jgi:hypothetical protein
LKNIILSAANIYQKKCTLTKKCAFSTAGAMEAIASAAGIADKRTREIFNKKNRQSA